MNKKILIIITILAFTNSMYAAKALHTTINTSEEAKISKEIKESKSIDELIEKMNRSKIQYKFLYMNAIKRKILASKKEDREEKIKAVLEKMNREKAEKQSKMKSSNSTKKSTETINNKTQEKMNNMENTMSKAHDTEPEMQSNSDSGVNGSSSENEMGGGSSSSGMGGGSGSGGMSGGSGGGHGGGMF